MNDDKYVILHYNYVGEWPWREDVVEFTTGLLSLKSLNMNVYCYELGLTLLGRNRIIDKLKIKHKVLVYGHKNNIDALRKKMGDMIGRN